MKIRFICLLLFTLFFVGCEQEYDIDQSNFQPKLVVYSVFTDTNPWNIYISHTNSIYENSDLFTTPKGVKVEIHTIKDGFLYELYQNTDENFSHSEFRPQKGRTYILKVSAPGYKSVVATGSIPEDINFKVNKLRKYIDEDTPVSVNYEIDVLSENSYDLIWKFYNDVDFYDDDFDVRSLESIWDSPFENFRRQTKNNELFVYKSDSKIRTKFTHESSTSLGNYEPGVLKIEKIPFYCWNLVDGYYKCSINDENNGNDALAPIHELRVMTLSDDLSEYYSTIKDYFRYNPISTLVPPKSIHSNIRNGYGIFSGFNEQTLRF